MIILSFLIFGLVGGFSILYIAKSNQKMLTLRKEVQDEIKIIK